MKSKSVRTLVLAATLATTLVLPGCGNTSINATTEGDSTADSTISVEATSDVTTVDSTAAASDSDADVIAPNVIAPTEITQAPATAATGTPTPTPTAEEKPGYTVAGINFRASADGSSDVIDTIEPGESVTILGTEGNWTKIRYNGQEGYVATRFLTENKSEAEAAARDYDSDNSYDDENGSSDDSEDSTDEGEEGRPDDEDDTDEENGENGSSDEEDENTGAESYEQAEDDTTEDDS